MCTIRRHIATTAVTVATNGRQCPPPHTSLFCVALNHGSRRRHTRDISSVCTLVYMFMLIISTWHKVQYILWSLYSLLAAISTQYLHGKRRILAKWLSQLGAWRPEWHLCCCCSRNALEDLHNSITATRQLLAGRGQEMNIIFDCCLWLLRV